jgi:hypothetical protein
MATKPAVSSRLFIGAFAVLCFAGTAPLHADWREEVGYLRLLQTHTSGVPSSAAGGVTQVEAGNASGDFYLPNPSDSRFAGKTFVNKSSGTGVSGHATGVGAIFYGNSGSLIPDTATIDVYSADEWLSAIPYAETRRVQNHSWIVGQLDAGSDAEATVRYYNARIDHLVNQSGVVCVAGVNNGQSTVLPYLLAQGYNLVSVGLTNGQHSAGFTAYDGPGRIKPDLVAPDTLTSYATPQVASAAALLAQKLVQAPYSLSGASIPRTVKALLLAGATKEEFPSWSRSTTQPIDTRYGAGELNIHHAYRTLVGGRSTYGEVAPNTAWANWWVSSTLSDVRRTYYFEIPAGSVSPRFSAALVWHRPVTAASGSYSAAALPAIDLTLHNVAAGTFTLGAVVQSSESPVDNVEHLYVPELPAGRYALRVQADSNTDTDYALAWRTLPTVAVAATTPVAREIDGSPGVFTITRTGPTTSPLLVPLAWGGTSVSGVHYTTPPSSVLVPAGSASATVSVTPIADSVAQGDRTVTLSLASDWSLSAGSPASASVTIQDKPYDGWRFARFTGEQLSNPAVAGETADPDGDGLPNLLEYALGADPLAPDSTAHQPNAASTSDGHLVLTYFQPDSRSDLAYAVEWTADLAAASWQTGASVVAEIARVPAEGGELVTVQATADLATSPRQFLRLRVTRQ